MPIFDERLSSYAPIRYRSSSWWDTVTGTMRGFGRPLSELTQYVTPMADRNILSLESSWELGEQIERLNLPQWTPSTMLAATRVSMMMQFSILAMLYESNGRQIFDLAEPLTEAFQHSDVKDANLAGLSLPYPAFFVHFGKQLELVDGLGGCVDGAFVAHIEDRLAIGLSFAGEYENTVPGCYLDFTEAETRMVCHEAIEAAVQRRLEQIRLSAQGAAVDKAAAAALLVDAEEMQFTLAAHLFRRALPLVINALFYLESLGRGGSGKPARELPRQPGRGVPAELVAAWTAKPHRRYKVESQMTRLGYSMVRLVGVDFGLRDASTGNGGHVRPHWRRGHWRMQPFGPGLAETRRIWLRPVFVHREEVAGNDETLPGHLYRP